MIIDKAKRKCNPEYFTKSRLKFLRISQKKFQSGKCLLMQAWRPLAGFIAQKKMRRPKAAHPDLQILIKLWTDTRLYVYRSSARRRSRRTAVH